MSKYNKRIKLRIAQLTELGWPMFKICEDIGISRETYYEWKRVKPDLSEAMKKAEDRKWESRRLSMEVAIDKLIDGYEVDYTETTAQQDGNNEDGSPKYKVTEIKKLKKIFAPNVAMVQTMLKALEPDKFTDKQKVEVEHSIANTRFNIKRRPPANELPEGTVRIQPTDETENQEPAADE